MVAYVILFLELVPDKALDYRCFSYSHLSQEYYLEFDVTKACTLLCIHRNLKNFINWVTYYYYIVFEQDFNDSILNDGYNLSFTNNVSVTYHSRIKILCKVFEFKISIAIIPLLYLFENGIGKLIIISLLCEKLSKGLKVDSIICLCTNFIFFGKQVLRTLLHHYCIS